MRLYVSYVYMKSDKSDTPKDLIYKNYFSPTFKNQILKKIKYPLGNVYNSIKDVSWFDTFYEHSFCYKICVSKMCLRYIMKLQTTHFINYLDDSSITRSSRVPTTKQFFICEGLFCVYLFYL